MLEATLQPSNMGRGVGHGSGIRNKIPDRYYIRRRQCSEFICNVVVPAGRRGSVSGSWPPLFHPESAQRDLRGKAGHCSPWKSPSSFNENPATPSPSPLSTSTSCTTSAQFHHFLKQPPFALPSCFLTLLCSSPKGTGPNHLPTGKVRAAPVPAPATPDIPGKDAPLGWGCLHPRCGGAQSRSNLSCGQAGRCPPAGAPVAGSPVPGPFSVPQAPLPGSNCQPIAQMKNEAPGGPAAPPSSRVSKEPLSQKPLGQPAHRPPMGRPFHLLHSASARERPQPPE